MKIVRFIPNCLRIQPRLGAVQDSKVVDLAVAYRSFLLDSKLCSKEGAFRLSETLIPGDTVLFLENGDLALEVARQALTFANGDKETSVQTGEKIAYSHHEVRLLSPIQQPRNLRDFLSFEEHIRNARKRRGEDVPPDWYELPVYYKGNTSTIIGPDEVVEWPRFTQILDYELEFACVIGKSGRDIQETEAESHIFGYMVMNDFSARDIQFKEMRVGLGPAKGKDFATAFGPYLVTKDEIPDPYNMKMIARVNGEVWSEGNTNTMYRKFPKIIEHVSNSEDIVAGDVFGSGTVGLGCGLELGKSLNEGDVVELEIEGLGVLRNRVVKR